MIGRCVLVSPARGGRNYVGRAKPVQNQLSSVGDMLLTAAGDRRFQDVGDTAQTCNVETVQAQCCSWMRRVRLPQVKTKTRRIGPAATNQHQFTSFEQVLAFASKAEVATIEHPEAFFVR